MSSAAVVTGSLRVGSDLQHWSGLFKFRWNCVKMDLKKERSVNTQISLLMWVVCLYEQGRLGPFCTDVQAVLNHSCFWICCKVPFYLVSLFRDGTAHFMVFPAAAMLLGNSNIIDLYHLKSSYKTKGRKDIAQQPY